MVYEAGSPIKTISVKSLNDQMAVVENPNISSFVLSADGQILLATVEIQDKSKSSKVDSPASKDYDFNSKEYRQSWGEKYSNIFHTSLLVLNVNNGRHLVIEKVGSSLCEPFFFQTDSSDQSLSVGCIGYQENPYKMGIIFCQNRVTSLYGIKLSSLDLIDVVSPVEPELYRSGNVLISSPRVWFNRGEKGGRYDSKAVYLEHDAGGAHDKSARLRSVLCFIFQSN